MGYSNEELLDDIRDVATIAERTPSIQDYRNHGTYDVTTITGRFESWQDAVARAGFEPHAADTKIPAAELLAELRRLADKHNKRPTVELMKDDGQYSASTYQRRFGSWTNALSEIGFDPTDVHRDNHIPEADLLIELERIATVHGTAPTFEEMERNGTYSPRTYVDRFGSWNEALEAAGFEPRDPKR